MTFSYFLTAIIGLALMIVGVFAYFAPETRMLRRMRRYRWLPDFSKNFSFELVGAGLTTILFSVVVGAVAQQEENREKAAAELAERERLIRDAGSSDNGFALHAIDELRVMGLLTDGTLAGEDFKGADLRNADLSGANLSGVDLRYADLRGANLFEANLSGADLRYTLLQEANTRELFDVDEVRSALRERLFSFDTLMQAPGNFAGIALLQSWAYGTRTNFSGADLRGADLTGSDWSFSNFTNANLLSTNFTGANLFMVDLTGAIIVEDLQGAFLGQAPISQTGYPPELTDALMPNGTTGGEDSDLIPYVDPEAEDYIDLSACQSYARTPLDDVDDTPAPPISCGMIWQTIPYPPRQPGPFRE
jgi:uncharacterized protein YjbI with pentapeptide repeats